MRQAIFTSSFLTVILIAVGSAWAVEAIYEEETQEYSWYSQPSVALGVMDADSAIEVHPDTWGRLVFLTGDEPEILQKRVKYRLEGYLPIIECSEQRDN